LAEKAIVARKRVRVENLWLPYLSPISHEEGKEWVVFEEGSETEALDSHVSLLQRYFYRPKRQPWSGLKYCEYFEDYIVSKNCPRALPCRFPHIFPEAPAASAHQNPITISPVLDEAPAGNHFLSTHAYAANIQFVDWK
jgi:hypothetical protein